MLALVKGDKEGPVSECSIIFDACLKTPPYKEQIDYVRANAMVLKNTLDRSTQALELVNVITESDEADSDVQDHVESLKSALKAISLSIGSSTQDLTGALQEETIKGLQVLAGFTKTHCKKKTRWCGDAIVAEFGRATHRAGCHRVPVQQRRRCRADGSGCSPQCKFARRCDDGVEGLSRRPRQRTQA